jgi:endonuclease/exonuclease/phosphatase family metal-dependent hydrolase
VYRVYHELLLADAEHPYQSEPLPIPLGNDPTRPSALVSDGLNRFSVSPFGPLTRVRWTDCFGDANVGAADCLAMKGFSVATHTLAEGVEVDVYNLHAEAGSTERDEELKVDNFRQLADFILEHSAGRAIIFGGDTNLHTGRSEHAAIWNLFREETGLEDVCELLDCGADDHKIDKFALRSSDTLALEALDHEFVREKFVRPTDGQPLSDHPPLVVHIQWTTH